MHFTYLDHERYISDRIHFEMIDINLNNNSCKVKGILLLISVILFPVINHVLFDGIFTDFHRFEGWKNSGSVIIF